MPKALRSVLGAVTVLMAFGGACGDDGSGAAPPATTPTASAGADGAVVGDITVFAASSLTGAFTELGARFMASHPHATVTFSFAASSELVTQIGEGAPADVYASADPATMRELTDAGGVGSPAQTFATNALEILVAPGNPHAITGVADLADPELIVVSGAPEVPIGRYAAEVLTKAGVTVTPKSYEQNVKGVVTKVTSGEADAGIVYRTDVAAAGSAGEGVEIPAELNVIADYPIAVTREAPNPAGGRAFVRYVVGETGQEVLARFGFTGP